MSSPPEPHDAAMTDEPAAERHTNRKILAVVGVVVIAAIAVGVVALGGESDDGASPAAETVTSSDAAAPSTSSDADPVPSTSVAMSSDDTVPDVPVTPAPTTSDSTTLPSQPVEPPDDRVATRTVEDFLAETVEAINPSATSNSGSLPDLSQVAIGAVLGELDATRAEFEVMGWTQVGAPTIADLRVVTPPTEAAPTEVVVEACLDNSDVRIVDSAGNDVRTSTTAPRSLNIYVLRWTEGRWLVAEHTFPDDPDC